MQIPLITPFWDIFIVAVLFSVVNKVIQHFFTDSKEYFRIKHKTKQLNEEQKKLMKEHKFEEVQKKQKESMELVGEQMKLTFKSMLPSFIISLPVLVFINKFYRTKTINMFLFNMKGFWAFFVMIFVFSMIVNALYDNIVGKKYK